MTVVIPIPGQHFTDFADWVANAKAQLTNHPDYCDTEQGKPGYRGPHFRALCYDQKGRRCADGAAFQLAANEQAFPVWYVWPDQIAQLATERQVFEDICDDLARQLHQMADQVVPVFSAVLDKVGDPADPQVVALRATLDQIIAFK